MARHDSTTEPAWVLPGEPVPVRLMNTIWADRDGVHDALSTPNDLARWLCATGVLDRPRRVTRGELAQARALRDALRRLAALVTEETPTASAPAPESLGATHGGGSRRAGRRPSPVEIDAAIAQVNATAAAVPNPPRLRLLGGRLCRDGAPAGRPVASALCAVAAAAIELLADPDARPLGACHAPGCVLYFVRDHPRREWCSTACGNRARAARHYHRHRERPG